VPSLSASQLASLDKILSEFGLVDAQRVKDIEKTTNHDVKAVEYYLKEKVSELYFMSAYDVACWWHDVE
jgi:adenylosuccinate lyase